MQSSVNCRDFLTISHKNTNKKYKHIRKSEKTHFSWIRVGRNTNNPFMHSLIHSFIQSSILWVAFLINPSFLIYQISLSFKKIPLIWKVNFHIYSFLNTFTIMALKILSFKIEHRLPEIFLGFLPTLPIFLSICLTLCFKRTYWQIKVWSHYLLKDWFEIFLSFVKF